MQFSIVTNVCRCRRVTDLFYCRVVDEYLCEDCADEVEVGIERPAEIRYASKSNKEQR